MRSQENNFFALLEICHRSFKAFKSTFSVFGAENKGIIPSIRRSLRKDDSTAGVNSSSYFKWQVINEVCWMGGVRECPVFCRFQLFVM